MPIDKDKMRIILYELESYIESIIENKTNTSVEASVSLDKQRELFLELLTNFNLIKEE